MRPYLKVANVFENHIDATEVMSMNFEPDEFERYRLHPGDILLNEGQSPEFLGRPALYRGEPENVAFTDSLIRFKAADGILPEWALIVFRRHMHFRRFMRESRITTNIAHLSATRFKSVEFPVPPTAEQRRIADEVDIQLGRLEVALQGVRRLVGAVNVSSTSQLGRLRTHILGHAYSGQLVPQDPRDEPAGYILKRIAEERSALLAGDTQSSRARFQRFQITRGGR